MMKIRDQWATKVAQRNEILAATILCGEASFDAISATDSVDLAPFDTISATDVVVGLAPIDSTMLGGFESPTGVISTTDTVGLAPIDATSATMLGGVESPVDAISTTDAVALDSIGVIGPTSGSFDNQAAIISITEGIKNERNSMYSNIGSGFT